jgi:cation diffusion facilitator family transporter
MAGADHGTKHIIQSLLVNTVIAVAKLAAAFFTHSGAMLAEGIHSAADCGNQLLLLWGVKEGQRPADDKHPLGYGRNVYFWSFMVALLLFSGGGVFSVYEGIHKLQHYEPVDHIEWAIGILGFSLLLEGWATFGNVKELNKRRAAHANKMGFIQFLRETKDSDLVVVFGENSAAVLGLAVALLSILAAQITGDPRADAIGTLAVGVVLIAVAVFLAIEVKSLLVGEAADPEIKKAAEELAITDTRLEKVVSCITMQQGPGEVLVALKIKCEPGLTAKDISEMINEFEVRLRSKCPEAKWIYVEPDLSDADVKVPSSSSSSATAATG